jgi:hypothetical protein
MLLAVPAVAYAAALALSSRTNLLMYRCVLTVVPCVLLALAVAIAEQRRRLPARLGFAALALPLGWLLVEARPGAGHRSNAPDVAAIVDAGVRPGDLIVVAPEFYASSLNYYLRASNPQIDYPHFGRTGLVPYVNQVDRSADPAALVRARSALRAQRAAAGRVWFVKGDWPTEADERDLPRLRANGSWPDIGALRARQLREELVALYGAPIHSSARTARPGRYETIVAELFAPRGAPAPGDAP